MTVALLAWAVGIAVLAFSVPTKLSSWPVTARAWPLTGRWSARLASPAVVTAVEMAVITVAVLPLPTGPRLATVGVVYAAYTAAAVVLLGRRCSCFGSWLTTRFTVWHVAGDGAVAAMSLAAAGAGGPPRLTATFVSGSAAAAGVLAGLASALLLRRLGAPAVTPPPARPELIDHVVIYGTDTCPYCATLWDQQAYYRSLAGRPVSWRELGADDHEPAAADGVPAAVGYSAEGARVAGPVSGLSAIRDLLAATAGPLAYGNEDRPVKAGHGEQLPSLGRPSLT